MQQLHLNNRLLGQEKLKQILLYSWLIALYGKQLCHINGTISKTKDDIFELTGQKQRIETSVVIIIILILYVPGMRKSVFGICDQTGLKIF